MKITSSILAAAFATAMASQYARACDSVFVESMSKSQDSAAVTISLNASPADSLGFTLSAGASRTDMLSIGAGSPDTLTLSAHVIDGSMSANCQTSVINQNNATVCSGVIDPQYVLMISSGSSDSVGTTGGGDDNDPTCTDKKKHCHHDNGHHYGIVKGAPAWGYRRQIAKCHGGNDNGGSDTPTPPTTTSTLSCQFVLVGSF